MIRKVTVTLALVFIAVATSTALGALPPLHKNHRTCFPAKQWGPVADQYRPCVRIVRLYEDGSFKFAVSDADGTVRYSAGVGALDR